MTDFLRQRLKSFTFAFNGLKVMLCEQANARIHLLVAVCVVLAGFVLHISFNEWIAITLCIGFVFSMELFNSSIEYLADFVSPHREEKIKKVKDLAAAAVLVSALCSVIVGGIIFLPFIIALF